MADLSYKFLVQNMTGEHSYIWSVVVSENNCYVSAGGVKGYKASFHESGDCQVGLTSNLRKTLGADWEGKSRHFDQWAAKADLSPGEIAPLLEIIISGSQLDVFPQSNIGIVHEISCEPYQCIGIQLSKANMSGGVIASSEPGFFQLSRLPLKNGLDIVVLKREITTDSLDNFLRACVIDGIDNADVAGKAYLPEAISGDETGLRAMVFHKKEDGHRLWIEASVRKCLSAFS